MDRTRVRRRRRALGAVLGAGVLLGSFAAGMQIGQAEGREPGPARAYVVQPSDTIWSIAAAEAGPGEDPRPVVDAILEVNDVDAGSLVPGRSLAIPKAG